MDVEKEDFKKLKQSDRIEFLLRLKRIEDNNAACDSILLSLACWFTVMIMLFYIAFGIKFIIKNLFIFKIVFMLLILFLLLEQFYNIYLFIKSRKEEEELEKEFFEIKNKGGKKDV